MTAPIKPTSIFVYGTLKPGEANYDRYCAGRVTFQCAAIAPGYLYALPVGYPAMVAIDRGAVPGAEPERHRQNYPAADLETGKSEAIVWGYLLKFSDPSCLRQLDELEDYFPQRSPSENEYYRTSVALLTPERQPLGSAWVYLMEPQRVRQMGGRRVLQGQWTGRLGRASETSALRPS